MAKDEERKFRLRPRKPAARSERRVLASAYKTIMHYARMSGVRKRRTSAGSKRSRPYFQRCAVRVIYSKNANAGLWRAHGRYIVRESITFDGGSRGMGFDEKNEQAEIVQRLEDWQQAGDERLWKLIISPEFGDRADLRKLTHGLLSEIEKNLGTALEWVAVAHFNTEHPHVHVALRGVGAEGTPIRFSRDYVKQGIREIAQDLCTRQLGYRSQWDAAEAQRREVQQHRYTSLDRAIKRDGMQEQDGAATSRTVALDPNPGKGNTQLLKQHMTERLLVLLTMGLAEHAGPNLWRVRSDFEDVLRAMQRSSDRQKTLAAHGALVSDERLPLEVLDIRSLTTLEGRILVHGEEESSGRSYFMLEGTDARIHHVSYTPEMEAARNRGGLRTNSFVRLRKLFKDGRPTLEIDDLGDSEVILRNKGHLRETAKRLIRRGIIPQEDGWNGWLGRYQKALSDAATALDGERPVKETRRDRNRGLGR
jgi:type IV secretory pathway VirD2 relaxase